MKCTSFQYSTYKHKITILQVKFYFYPTTIAKKKNIICHRINILKYSTEISCMF